MVSRLPPPEDGRGRDRDAPAGRLVPLLVVLVVIVGGWLFLDGGDDDGGADGSVAIDDTSASAPEVPSVAPSESGPDDQGDGSADDSGTSTLQGSTDPESGLPTVYLLDLPPEAAETVGAIERGPPYAYDKDGSTFGNYEGLLPDAERGYYQEFTVETPGSSDRGARRIVEGAEGELYWTDDHYASFSRILP